MKANLPDDSLEICNSLLREIEQFVKKDPENKSLQYELSIYNTRIGYVHFTQRNFTAALNFYTSTLKIIERLLREEPDNVSLIHNLSIIYELIGDVNRDEGNLSAALISYSSSIKYTEQAGKRKSINNQLLIKLFTHYKQEIDVEKLQDDIATTLLRCLQDLAIRKEIFGENHPVYIKGLRNLENLFKNPDRSDSDCSDINSIFNNLPDRAIATLKSPSTDTHRQLEKFISDELERTKDQT